MPCPPRAWWRTGTISVTKERMDAAKSIPPSHRDLLVTVPSGRRRVREWHPPRESAAGPLYQSLHAIPTEAVRGLEVGGVDAGDVPEL